MGEDVGTKVVSVGAKVTGAGAGTSVDVAEVGAIVVGTDAGAKVVGTGAEVMGMGAGVNVGAEVTGVGAEVAGVGAGAGVNVGAGVSVGVDVGVDMGVEVASMGVGIVAAAFFFWGPLFLPASEHILRGFLVTCTMPMSSTLVKLLTKMPVVMSSTCCMGRF